MVSQDFHIDLKKPLVFQMKMFALNDFPSYSEEDCQSLSVGHLGEAYQEWVHQPIVCKESPRFFENEFLEFSTRTVWWVVPTVWLPVVCYLISKSSRMGRTFPDIVLMVLCDILVWTLLEYTLHHFLFHIKTKSYWGNTMHYLLHGYHHKHPMDEMRLVIPLTGSAISILLFWNIFRLMLPPSVAPALFGGDLLGYVAYDVTHYYLPNDCLKRYHLNHHFRIQSKGFGVTSSLWDKIFATLPSSKAAEKMNHRQSNSVG